MSLKQFQGMLLVIAAMLLFLPDNSVASEEQLPVGKDLEAEAETAVDSAREPGAKHGGSHLNPPFAWFVNVVAGCSKTPP